jgi:hypothetical protein
LASDTAVRRSRKHPALIASAALVATSVAPAGAALVARGPVTFRVALGVRIDGRVLLRQGDRVICLNPGRWIAVTLPAPNARHVIRASRTVRSGGHRIRLSVTKNTRTGVGAIACVRLHA